MKNENRKERTLREVLAAINTLDLDIDIEVDGVRSGLGDVIAVVAPVKLTQEARKHFAKALDLPVVGSSALCVISHNNADYDNILDYEDGDKSAFSALVLAWQLLKNKAGYCSCADYAKWFKGEDAEEI